MYVKLAEKILKIDKVIGNLDIDDKTGAIIAYIGIVRGFSRGEKICALSIDTEVPKAHYKLRNILAEIRDRFRLVDINVEHRLGIIDTKTEIMNVAIASHSRSEGILSLFELINKIKSSGFIEKEEILYSGERRRIPKEKENIADVFVDGKKVEIKEPEKFRSTILDTLKEFGIEKKEGKSIFIVVR